MSESLADRRELDHASLWRAMRALLDRVSDALEGGEAQTRDDALDDALDIVVDILGADRGIILLTRADGSTQVVRARGSSGELRPVEREQISRSVIRHALEGGRLVAWDPMSEGGRSESVSTLGIVAALAAPLFGARAVDRAETRGVLYVDFRDPKKHVGPRHVEFFGSAALLLAGILEQHRLLQIARAHLREARAHCVEARPTPPLDELLAPPSMARIRRDVRASVHGSSPILVLGESGTGKTLLAQAIAEASGRRPIVRAVLGSSDDLNTITSELFGHERGAFSGATGRRVGLVEYAHNGTLVLDEILNLSPQAQKLLLDFTQFGNYRPLGHDRAEPKTANVRIIAVTNGDLHAAMRDGRFREDLYHRLAAVTLTLPPLRERRGELADLAESYLRRADPGRRWSVSLGLRRLLASEALGWSGNVRQLERLIGRARERALLEDPEASTLGPEHFDAGDAERQAAGPGVSASGGGASPTPIDADDLSGTWTRLQAERRRVEELEGDAIRAALARSEGVVSRAARELGIARSTLASRIEVLGLDRRGPRG